MPELNKETAVNDFIAGLLKVNTPEIINSNKDYILKALRLLSDDNFWGFYQSHKFVREYIVSDSSPELIEKLEGGVKESTKNKYYEILKKM